MIFIFIAYTISCVKRKFYYTTYWGYEQYNKNTTFVKVVLVYPQFIIFC